VPFGRFPNPAGPLLDGIRNQLVGDRSEREA
jgi:hypothetical protein